MSFPLFSLPDSCSLFHNPKFRSLCGAKNPGKYGANPFSDSVFYPRILARRLIFFVRRNGTQQIEMDAVGNWTTVFTNGMGQARSYNNQNQLTAISGATLPTYDANGNTTTDDKATTYTFDVWNRLVKEVAGSTTLVYGYDALGRPAR